MGKKMPFEQGIQAGSIPEPEDIFTNSNKYGYRLNVNHRLIRPLYERYKEQLGERILSDSQRKMFEAKVIAYLESGGKG